MSTPAKTAVDAMVSAYERGVADAHTNIDALRPPCPTCGGTGKDGRPFKGLSPKDFIGMPDERMVAADCPDCVDGKVSIEQLAATWRAVWETNAAPYGIKAPDSIVAYCQGHNALRDRLQSVRP